MDFAKAREEMIEDQILRRGVHDAVVLAAMRIVPREAFVPPDLADEAYEDRALPIGEGQTVSQPFIVALMLVAAKLESHNRVLEVGAGSGYAAAVISRIAEKVFGIERDDGLTQAARTRLEELRYGNVELRTGDGSFGWQEAAPFDAIIVSAGGAHVPEALKRQLADGGRLVMPVGPLIDQRLVRLIRHGDEYTQDDLGGVRFVALVSES
ncbi:MAG TPA: protein-L-isoaspartate(D-aspartate) O-methyltransferase [Rhizomicrobium sp.]|nr:protein-L-isoaspartate(D-aspartate) O-methyltransferase [Rhizomicrobium sp.]